MINFADEFEKGLYEQIVNGDKLTECELMDLLEFEVDEIKGGDRRWTRSMKTICQLGDKYFALEWEQGLTENQENQFYNQPYEVTFTEEVVTKTIKKWNKVINNSISEDNYESSSSSKAKSNTMTDEEIDDIVYHYMR